MMITYCNNDNDCNDDDDDDDDDFGDDYDYDSDDDDNNYSMTYNYILTPFLFLLGLPTSLNNDNTILHSSLSLLSSSQDDQAMIQNILIVDGNYIYI